MPLISVEEGTMGTQHETIRRKLRVIGPVVIFAGILLIVGGCAEQSAAQKRHDAQAEEWMQGRRKMHDIASPFGAAPFLIGGGMLALFIGLAITAFSFQGALLRYSVREMAPGVKEGLQEVAPALAGMLGHPAAAGGLRCTNCSVENPGDAKFCKGCGSLLRQSVDCHSCGQRNEPDAKFCTKCGGQLD
jgi:ribosomal protein L40E